MLIEFRVENHRSIREEQAITMEAAASLKERPDVVRREDGHASGLLPVIALYGANASGKSNVLAAMDFMRDAVRHSLRSWDPDGGIPRDPFAWGPSKAQPSTFEVTFLLQSVRYEYGFVVDDESFLEEWLFAFPHGRKQTWFKRDGAEFSYGEQLKGEARLVEPIVRRNALFLSAAGQTGIGQLAPIFRWFGRVRSLNVDRHLIGAGRVEQWLLPRPMEGEEHESAELQAHLDARRLALRQLLSQADVGITDIRVKPVGGEEGTAVRRRRLRVQLKHSNPWTPGWLSLEEESRGTIALSQAAPHLLDCLGSGSVLLVDELEASLHPLLAIRLAELFLDPITNPRGAQLIFTTHDTNLIGNAAGESVLRRDQVWFTEKDLEGATHVYPLTDYHPRKAENLERGYLQGRYGAIPFIGKLVAPDKS